MTRDRQPPPERTPQPRRRCSAADDARGEARPARRPVGGRRRGRRGRRPAAGRDARRRAAASRSSPRDGLGQITRIFGTAPVEPGAGARAARAQRWLVAQHPARHPRHRPRGVPDRARRVAGHDLSRRRSPGARPSTPTSSSGWARAIGASMAALGIHQGLAPVLDVVRDARWGRVEECIGEDPYLVGTIGTAYVRGLQSRGRHRHPQALRRVLGLARRPQPGPGARRAPRARRRAALALRDGGARRRRPLGHALLRRDRRRPGRAPTRTCLTELLRDGGASTAPSSPTTSAVAFLHTPARRRRRPRRRRPRRRSAAGHRRRAAHRRRLPRRRWPTRSSGRGRRVAGRPGGAARAAPEGGARAARRRLRPPDAAAGRRRPRPARAPGAGRAAGRGVRRAADQRRRAAAGRRRRRVAVDRPERRPRRPRCSAATPSSTTSCRSTPSAELGHRVPTLLDALRAECPDAEIVYAARVRGRRRRPRRASPRRSAAARPPTSRSSSSATRPGCSAAAPRARAATSTTWSCPGVQRELVEAVIATGTPVVLVLLTGRPYAVGWAPATSCAAVVQAFFPGEEGAGAVARRAQRPGEPSGRLPVSLPGSAGGQPYTYLHPAARRRDLGRATSTPPRCCRSATG